jgi:hypothetical protein
MFDSHPKREGRWATTAVFSTPIASFYLSDDERAHLAAIGRPQIAEQPAGSYARQILNRLLIDLAWNLSRLEGNTYSLLERVDGSLEMVWPRCVALGQDHPGMRSMRGAWVRRSVACGG